jgi:hypothetical protein
MKDVACLSDPVPVGELRSLATSSDAWPAKTTAVTTAGIRTKSVPASVTSTAARLRRPRKARVSRRVTGARRNARSPAQRMDSKNGLRMLRRASASSAAAVSQNTLP